MNKRNFFERMKATFAMVAAALCLGILAQSCDKEEEFASLNDSAIELKMRGADYSEKEYALVDSLISRYALVVCRSMENEAFREILKEEAMQRFDGDYDVLAITLQKRMLYDKSQTVEELLAATYDKHFAKPSGMTGKEFLRKVNGTVPNLQVAVPVQCETWKPQQQVPAVVPLPYTFEDDKHDAITAYDVNGEPHKVSLKEEPAVPYVVVSVSERITRNGLRRKELFKPIPTLYGITLKQDTTKSLDIPAWLTVTNGKAYALNLNWGAVQGATEYVVFRKEGSRFLPHATVPGNQTHYVDTNLVASAYYWYMVSAVKGSDTSATSRLEKNIAAARDNGAPFVLTGINYEDGTLSNVESWVRGTPEIHITVVGKGENGYSAYILYEDVIEPSSRDDVDDNWWNPTETLMNSWATSHHGEMVTIAFTEDDNRLRTEYRIGGGNDSYEVPGVGTAHYAGHVTIRTDDVTGQTFLSFCDSYMDFDLGSFSFRWE